MCIRDRSGPHDKDRDDKAGDSVDGQCGVRRRDQRKYGEGCDEHIGIVFPNSGPQRGGIQFFIYFRDIYDQKCFDRYGDQRHQKMCIRDRIEGVSELTLS